MSLLKVSGKAVLAIAASLAFAGAGQAESLKSALAKAYENSGVLAQNQALLNAADESVVAAAGALLPAVQASISHSYRKTEGVSDISDSTSFSISARMPIYDFGRGQLGIDLAKEAVAGTRLQLASIEQSVLLNAIEAFMQYRQATELVRLRENNLKVIDQELRAANDRFEVGEITRTDVAMAEAAKAQSLSALAQARGDLERSTEAYMMAVGSKPNSPDAPVNLPSLPASASAAKAAAAKGHPDVLAAQSQVKQAEIRLAQAEANAMPSISLSGSLSRNDQTSLNMTSSANLGVEATIPLYQGGQIDSGVRQATAQLSSAKSALRVAVLNSDLQVGSAYARLNVARANMQATEQQIAAAQIAFDGLREEAKLGARTTLDVLNAEQNLLDAKANRVIASTEVVNATYAVVAALGQLSAKGLGLQVDLFDPEAYAATVQTAAPSMRGLQLDKVLGKLGN
jgi:outer membrane protein